MDYSQRWISKFIICASELPVWHKTPLNSCEYGYSYYVVHFDRVCPARLVVLGRDETKPVCTQYA